MKIAKRGGVLELVADEYKLADGEEFVPGHSTEGLEFLEGVVEQEERAAKSADAMERLAKIRAQKKEPAARLTALAEAGAPAVLDGDGADTEKRDAGKDRKLTSYGDARQGLGLDVYSKMTDGEARGGTRDFAEFCLRVAHDPVYKRERQKLARAVDNDLYSYGGGAQLDTRALAEGATATGGALVPPQYIQELLDLAYSDVVAVKAGVQTRAINTNIANLPTLTTAATAAWVAENGAVTPADIAFGQQTMTISKLMAGIKVSNEMIADSDPAVGEVIAQNMAKVIALQLDAGILEGSGSAPVIRGVANVAGVTAGPNLGANGATPTLDNIYDAFYNLYAANIADEDRWAFVFHPRVLNTLRKIKDTTNNYILSTGNGVNAPISRPAGLLGVPYYTSTQINIARTVGTSSDCTNVYVGRWHEMIVFTNGAFTIDLTADGADATNSGFWSDQTWIRAKQRVGFLVRRPAGICVINGVRP